MSNSRLTNLPKGPASLVRSSHPTNSSSRHVSQQNSPSSPIKSDSGNEEGKLTSTIQLARPFLTKEQIKLAQKATIDNITVYDQRKNQVLQFLMRICTSLKFPIKTLETSMIFYQRYFLHNKFNTTVYYDIAITSLFIASKNEDTIKKLRDIILIGNQIRNLQMNNDNLDLYRKKILRLEFKLLETISFDFRNFHVEEFLIKFVKKLSLSKEIGYLAWLISYDSFQTEIALKVPPHNIALAAIIIATNLKDLSLEVQYKEFHTEESSVNEALLDLLDLYINSYNYTGLVNFYPDLKDKFLEIKLQYSDMKGLRSPSSKVLEKDDYFKDRDFANGERRYMLANQRKRLYNER